MFAEFDAIYRQMGELGWSPGEVDVMELWQVARFLGVGGTPPTIRGARHIQLREGAETETAGEINPTAWGDAAPLAAQLGQAG